VYDGGGQRVKSVINGETVLFVGGYFEQKGNEVTKHYPGGAIRKYTILQSMSVEYTLGDQLGSASVMTDTAGNKVSEMRYTPWGQVRYSWVDPNLSTTPAYTLPKHTFTGQYSYMDDPSTQGFEGFGLMFYNARFYDPQVGRFAQADSIVPGGVQGLDRYAYVGNNPVNYTDPSGHRTQHPKDCEWDHSGYCTRILPQAQRNAAAGQGFTPEQIYNYILSYCGGDDRCADAIYASWQADQEWWAMLRAAQPGDILIGSSYLGTYGSSVGFLYQFTGDENGNLSGIEPYKGHGVALWPDPDNITLVDIQRGYYDPPSSRFVRIQLNWYGFIHFDNNNWPTLILRPGVAVIQRYYKDGVRTTIEFVAALGFGIPTLLVSIAGGWGIEAMIGGTVGDAAAGVVGVNWLFDAANMEKGDVLVCFYGSGYNSASGSGYDSACVNFQQNTPGTGYTIE
jgi:RHS repeat-associated protein